MFHPDYYGERGPRTVWHNILMGLSLRPYFAGHFGFSVIDDNRAADSVIRYLTERNDPRLTSEWTREKIMNSLGGQSKFTEWKTYEAVAREMVLNAVWANPLQAWRAMSVQKYRHIRATVFCQAMLLTCGVVPVSFAEARFNPLDVKYLLPLLGLAVVFIGWRRMAPSEVWQSEDQSVRVLMLVAASCAFLAMLGLGPSLIFYPALWQLAGTFMFGAISIFAFCAAVFIMIIRRIRFE